MLKKLCLMSISSMIATFAIFVFQILLTHLMSPNNNGIVSKWLTEIGYLSFIFVLGLDSSLLYYSRRQKAVEHNMGKNIIVFMIMFLLGFIVIAILPVDKIYYWTLVAVITMLSISSVINAYFQFYEKFHLYNLLLIIRPILILISFLYLFLNGSRLDYEIALFVYAGGVAISLFIALTINLVWGGISFSNLNLLDKNYYSYGLKSVINKVLSLTLYASCVYALSYTNDYESVAYFFVASSLSKMVWVFPDAAGNLLYPKFIKIKNDVDNNNVLNLMYYYGRVVFVISIISTFGFIVLGKYFLSIMYNKHYQIVFIPTIILLIGNYGMVYYKFLSRYLASKNNWKPLYYSLIGAINVNILLNLALIPYWGINGSAIACAISFWICGLSMTVYVKGSLLAFVNIKQTIREVNIMIGNIRSRLSSYSY